LWIVPGLPTCLSLVAAAAAVMLTAAAVLVDI